MKKFITTISLSLSILTLGIFCGCSNNGDGDNNSNKHVSYQNTIYTKQELIAKVKELTNLQDFYYFDCDFSNLSTIGLSPSYNLSVSGDLIFDKIDNVYRIDFINSCEIEIVANYSISNNEGFVGFSFVSRLFEAKGKIIHGDGTESTAPLQLYDENTFSSISDLIDNQYTYFYTYDKSRTNIAVPSDFFNCNLNNVSSNWSCFYKNIPNSFGFFPCNINTYYEKTKFPEYSDDNILKNLTNYFYANAKYVKV